VRISQRKKSNEKAQLACKKIYRSDHATRIDLPPRVVRKQLASVRDSENETICELVASLPSCEKNPGKAAHEKEKVGFFQNPCNLYEK
jgi:hypothetical protein